MGGDPEIIGNHSNPELDFHFKLQVSISQLKSTYLCIYLPVIRKLILKI